MPSLTRFFLGCPELVPRDTKPALGVAYGKLMSELWQGDGPSYVAPTGVLHSVKQAWPAFRGFQQHDAQEFLRCAMDQLHRELCEPVFEEGEEQMVKKEAIESLSEVDSASGTGSEVGEEQYETADSEQGSDGKQGQGRKRKLGGEEQYETADSEQGSDGKQGQGRKR